MKICTIAVMFACMATSVAMAAPGGKVLNWGKNYGTSKKAAQAAKRPMLLVMENPTDKAKTLDDSKLRDQQREILAKDKFELVRVNVNTEYGKRVAAAFGAKQFPYTVVTDDASKHIVFRKPGAMSERDWTLALGKDVRNKFTAPAPLSVNYGFPSNGGMIIQAAPVSTTCFT